jgi:hypothetical protein
MLTLPTVRFSPICSLRSHKHWANIGYVKRLRIGHIVISYRRSHLAHFHHLGFRSLYY